jgi:hypothetical protein
MCACLTRSLHLTVSRPGSVPSHGAVVPGATASVRQLASDSADPHIGFGQPSARGVVVCSPETCSHMRS